MAAKISVLVPVYKTKEEYLRRCIESLCSQTLKEIQIILVDDGSPEQEQSSRQTAPQKSALYTASLCGCYDGDYRVF